MGSMISSILTVKQLMQSKPSLEIGYVRAHSSKVINKYTLPDDRCYVIPGYQREIGWKNNNIQVLIEDLTERSKFLGHILVSTYDDKSFNIIDGQQRLTVFYMILKAISSRDASSKIDTCAFENESFPDIKTAIETDFYAGDEDSIIRCKENDDLYQYDSFVSLTNYTQCNVVSCNYQSIYSSICRPGADIRPYLSECDCYHI